MIWQKTKQWLTYKTLKDNVFSRDSFSFLPSSRASRTLKKSLIELNIHVFNDSWGQCVKAWSWDSKYEWRFDQFTLKITILKKVSKWLTSNQSISRTGVLTLLNCIFNFHISDIWDFFFSNDQCWIFTGKLDACWCWLDNEISWLSLFG